MSVRGETSTTRPPAATTESILDRIYYPAFIAAIAFLAFVLGAFVILSQVFPYSYLNQAYRGAVAVFDQRTQFATPYMTDLWRPARTEARGVTVYDPALAYDGFTMYTSSHAQKASLVSMDGEVVHEWRLPLRAVWDSDDQGREPRPADFIFWDDVHLFPNGDLIVMYIGLGDTPWGYGLVKMNKDSEVIWTYFDHVHHDLDVGQDGTIYVLTNEIRTDSLEGFEHLRPPRIDDSITVLSPDGQEIKKVSVIDALLRSPYGRMLRTPAWNIKEDFLHTNSIDLIDQQLAKNLPFAKPGQVLLSLRDIDAIAVLDLDKETVVWALEGPWHRQHDADALPNGNLLLFDNFGHYGLGGMSRVIEIDPSTGEIVWKYTGDDRAFFQSDIRSGQQRLPNGNTLITESDGGRIFEVTRAGEIVWEYVNPVRAGEADELIPVFSRARRLGSDALDPDFLASMTGTSAAAERGATDQREVGVANVIDP